MKSLKMSVLAVVAAMGMMAFAEATIAQATILYTDGANTISYPAGTTIDLSLESGTSSVLTDTSGNTLARCTGSTVKGTIGTAAGTWVSGAISTLTWEGCKQTTDTINAGSLEIMQIGEKDEGEVVGKGTNVTLSILGTSCTYGTGEGSKLGTITGGEAPTMKITATLPKSAGGFMCPSTGIWHASYMLTEPHALHIGLAPVVSLNTDAAKTIPYQTGTVIDLSLKSGSSTKLTNGSETVATCTESTAKGKASEASEIVSVSLETLTWGGCSTTTDTLTNGKLEITATSGGNGEVIGQESKWTVTISGASCTYGLGEGVKLGTLVGGETPTLNIEALIPRTAGGILCPSAVTWDAEYVVTEPHALYIGPPPPPPATFLGTTTTGGRYPAGTSIHISLETGTSATLTDTSGNTIATCTGSTVNGATSNESVTWISDAISSLTWEGCNQTTDTVNAGSLEFMHTTGDEAEVVGRDSEVTLGIFGVSCTYGTREGTKLGTVTGGEAPTLKITTTIPKTAGGFLCPTTGIWHASYIFTEPHALHFG